MPAPAIDAATMRNATPEEVVRIRQGARAPAATPRCRDQACRAGDAAVPVRRMVPR